jgi:mannose-1-phosphate guanylyltransferase
MGTGYLHSIVGGARIPVFFLAAGLGTRLRPLTESLPKPLVPFLGIPLLIHAYGFLREQVELGPLYINTHYQADKLELWLRQNQLRIFGQEFYVSREENLLGGGGALIPLKSQLEPHEDFILMNADEVIFYSDESSRWLETFYQQHKRNNAIASLLVIKHPLAGNVYGAIWTNISDRSVVAVGKECPNQSGVEPWHYLGIMLLSYRILDYLPYNKQSFDLLREVLMPLLRVDPLSVNIYPENLHWFETGILDSFKISEEKILQMRVSNPSISRQMEFRNNLLNRR